MTNVEKHKFATLDAMRGVAALLVMFYHYFHFSFNHTLPHPLEILLKTSGYLAVDLFFVLSGFVIAFAYDDALRAGMSVWRFTRLRLVRLMPMIWVGVVLGTSLAFLGRPARLDVPMENLALNAVLLPGHPAIYGAMFATNPPEWSLFCELVANLLFATLFSGLSRKVLVALITAGAIGVLAFIWSKGTVLNAGFSYQTAWGGLVRVLFSFFCGVGLFRSRARWVDRVPSIPAWALLGLTAVVLVCRLSDRFQGFYDLAVIFVIAPALVALASTVEPSPRHRRWASGLALISYPLYAIHFPIMDLTARVEPHVHHGKLLLVVAATLGTVVLSYVLARYYDMPVRRRLRAIWLTDEVGVHPSHDRGPG